MGTLKYSSCKRFVNPLKFAKLELPATHVFVYEGDRKYLVHQDFCTCPDFLLRKIGKREPCKHICTVKYRSTLIGREIRLEDNEMKAFVVRVLLNVE